METVKYARCHTPGLAGTTDVIVRENPDGTYEARIGVAAFGAVQMSEAEFEACDYNPFHPEFRDNFCAGTGTTKEAALDALTEDFRSLHASLWV